MGLQLGVPLLFKLGNMCGAARGSFPEVCVGERGKKKLSAEASTRKGASTKGRRRPQGFVGASTVSF